LSLSVGGDGGVQRRHVSPEAWREIAHELSVGLHPGPIRRDAALWRSVAGGVHVPVALRYLHRRDFDIAQPDLTAGMLDNEQAAVA
jgi:hypothetical protein